MSKIDLSQLKPAEARALIVLMTQSRALTNKELREAGAELKSEHHQRLTAQGLMSVTRSGQSNVFDLTDRGWQALREPYASDPAAGAGRFLITLLTTLQRCLDRRQISHGEFFQPATAPPEAMSTRGVKARIRAAYESLPKAPGGWVGLADLRDQLTGLSRQAVDLALNEMSRERDVRVDPVANKKSLTARDREASLVVGQDEMNMIAIGVA